MYCFNCGTLLVDDADFCHKCGLPQKPDGRQEQGRWEFCEIVAKSKEGVLRDTYYYEAEAVGPHGPYIAGVEGAGARPALAGDGQQQRAGLRGGQGAHLEADQGWLGGDRREGQQLGEPSISTCGSSLTSGIDCGAWVGTDQSICLRCRFIVQRPMNDGVVHDIIPSLVTNQPCSRPVSRAGRVRPATDTRPRAEQTAMAVM